MYTTKSNNNKVVLVFVLVVTLYHSSLVAGTPTGISVKDILPVFCDERVRFENFSCGACVAKCCGLHQVWDMKKAGCVDVKNGVYWTPRFYELLNNKCVIPAPDVTNITDQCPNTTIRDNRRQVYDISVNNTELLKNCSATLLPFRRIGHIAAQRFRLLTNGSAILRDKYGGWHEIKPMDFCIDGMQKSTRKEYTGNEADTLLWACQRDYNFKRVKRGIPIFYAIMLFASSFLLFITAMVYILLWKQNGVYEWLVFCAVISNLFMIIFVATGHSIARDPENTDLGSTHCIFIGAAAHFFFLASFTFTFTICFELFWVFRKLELASQKSFGWRRLLLYQLTAWGGPGLTITIGLILDKKFGLRNLEVDCTQVTTPNYGLLNCYLSKPAQGPYLFYPIGVILACNLLLFTLTVLQMRKHKASTKSALKGPESQNNKNQSQLTTVFAKLFAIMGLSWIFALAAWLISSNASRQNFTNADEPGVPLNWIVYDIVITLQAIAIFFIFTCKNEILLSLWKRYPSLRVILKPFTYIPGCTVQQQSSISNRNNIPLGETGRPKTKEETTEETTK